MNLSAMKYVAWTEKPQTCKDVMARHSAPLLVRVEQGYCSEEDGESLGQGQVIRIQKWLKQRRVIAKDSGGRHYSFPVQFPVPFELLSEKKKTLLRKRVRTLAEIAKDFTLPKMVRMKANDSKPGEYAIAAAFGSEPLELVRIHEDVYLHGNAVNYGSIDPTVINIPIHVSLELKVGQGLENGDQTEWNRLLRDIDNVIAREAVYNSSRANQKILVYMPAKGSDDNDEILGIDVSRSVSSTDSTDEGVDDINQSFGDDDEDLDRNSTGGSASGFSVGSAEVLEEDDSSFKDEHQKSAQNDLEEFTNYTQTQRASFLLEDGGSVSDTGRRKSLNLDEFFKEQKGQLKSDEDSADGHLFKSNVSKLSFLRPQHWGLYTGPENQNGKSSTPSSRRFTNNSSSSNGTMPASSSSSSSSERTFTKFKTMTISKHAQKFRNKMSKKPQYDKTWPPPGKSSQTKQPKDVAPQKRLRRLSTVPTDVYSLTSQQVLDLLNLLDLSEFAPAFAFDRIDGRLLVKVSSQELIAKYGMDEEQAGKLMAYVNPGGDEPEEKTLSTYQITNSALNADYQQQQRMQNAADIGFTNRYF